MAIEPLVSSEWLAARVTAGNDLRVVHVSTDRKVYDERHIPGAVFSDLHVDLAKAGRPPETGGAQRLYILPTREEVESTLRAWGVGADTEIVFYDDIGQNRYAARGYWLLRAYGFPAARLHLLDGGLGAWEADERPTTTDEPAVKPTPTTAPLSEVDRALLATADDVRRWSEEATGGSAPGAAAPTRLLDVRLVDEYLGTDVRARRAGHIPGARQRPFTDLLAPDGKFRTGPQIRSILEAGGVRPDELRVTYCQGGVRAALAWFALHEIAGIAEVRNYAGSWEEWGNLPDTPIEQ